MPDAGLEVGRRPRHRFPVDNVNSGSLSLPLSRKRLWRESAEIIEHLCCGRVGGLVGPFVGIGFDVVEFFVAVVVVDQAPAIATNRVAPWVGEGGEGVVGPLSLGIAEQWQQAWSVVT